MNLDQYFPPCGPCGLCGHPDARHRIYDAITSRYKAGEEITNIADDYEIPTDVVYAVVGACSDEELFGREVDVERILETTE